MLIPMNLSWQLLILPFYVLFIGLSLVIFSAEYFILVYGVYLVTDR